MGFSRWQDMKHKATPGQMAQEKKEALKEYDRMGYAALRKARALTQVEMAERLRISQGNVAALEARTDLHISTLSKYIGAMGGRLEMQAIFPEATFSLEPLPPPPETVSAKRKATAPIQPKAKAPRSKPASGPRRTAGSAR